MRSHFHPQPRRVTSSLISALLAFAWFVVAVAPASAGQYYVVACDAAPGGASHAWQPQGGSYNTYKLCPTPGGGSPNGRGMVTRLTDRTFGAGEFSRLWFYAPGGTHVLRVDWSGRMARAACTWHVELRADGGFGVSPLLRWVGAPGQTSCETAYENPNVMNLWAPAGTTAVMQNTQCAAATCPSGATFHTYYAGVLLNDFSAPAISMSGVGEGEWVRSDRAVSFDAVDNIGIKLVKFYIDGHERPGALGYGCDYASPVPCSNHSGAFNIPTTQLSAGSHRIEMWAFDGSDTPVGVARNIRVDNTPPAHVTLDLSGGEGWRSINDYGLKWQPVADNGSPIVGGTWELCKPGRTACTTGALTQPNPTALSSVKLPADGAYEFRVALRDQAGNVAALRDARPAMLRLDREAPRVSIDPVDPNTPIRAAATVSDSVSGLGGGQLEMRRAGATTWQELPTAVEGNKLVAQIDDERFSNGRYELRARALDQAGNEASTFAEASGAQAVRQLPIRVVTRLNAGRKVARTVRRVVGRGKRKRTVKRREVRYRETLTVRRKRRAVVRGVLRNPDGQPLHDVPIQVSARPELPGAGFSTAAVVRTDRKGRFSYRLRGTISRTLRFRYDGTSRIRPATSDVTVKVPASSTFTLNPRRIVNGETVTFRGRVRGGPIPATGKLIELRRWTGRRWDPFRVVRTDPAGRWSHTEPVVSVSGFVIFRLRAAIPAEAGFPYSHGRTRARELRVRGL